MFLFSILQNKAKVNEKILEDAGIPLADVYADFEVDEENILAKCKTGDFYFGYYKNKKVIIKKVDITKDDLILNEFIFWNEQSGQLFYPNMIGVLLKYGYAYIIFKKDFIFTLKDILKIHKKELTNTNKIKIVRQLLVLLNFYEKNNIKHNELRSSIIGLDSDYIIKIIDYGKLVELNCQKEDIKDVEDEIKKYSPPEVVEFINDDYEQINDNFDIYSFGKILVDIFSSKNIENNKDDININKIDDININEINNKEEEEDNYNKNNTNKINFLLSSIINRCIEKDKNKRIKIDELNNNMQLVLDSYFGNKEKEKKDKIINNINENFLNENKRVNDCYQYGKNLMPKINNILDDMNNNLQNKIKYLKNDIVSQQQKALNQFNEFEKSIKDYFNKYINSSKKIICTFYNKLLESTINMQMETFSNSLNDLYDLINIGNGMLLDISVVSRFQNKDEYKSIEDYLEKTKNEINEILLKNSRDSEFDLIYKIYNNKNNYYQKYCEYINECISPLKQIQNNLEKYIEDNNNRIGKVLAINLDIDTLDENSEYFKSMNNNIYAKIKESTNIIYIFNYYSKLITTHYIDNITFNSKCYSFFDKEENCIYISGGVPDNDINYNYYDDSLLKISIEFIKKDNNILGKDNKDINIIDNKYKNFNNIFNYGEYNFELTKLNKLLNGRCSHCMIRSLKDRNMLINIGGKNTKTTEVYNLECNKSANINDLPSLCINPTSIEYNGCIYLFCNSEFGLNSVYCLDMNKFDNFVWVSIQYNIDAGGLKRGMNIIEINDSLYLFGGYDQSKEYSDVYKVDFFEEYLDINFCGNLSLNHDCSFNSNAIIENKNPEDKNKVIILMDVMNVVNELDLVTGKSNIYELE